jgi:hypothetical protein
MKYLNTIRHVLGKCHHHSEVEGDYFVNNDDTNENESCIQYDLM